MMKVKNTMTVPVIKNKNIVVIGDTIIDIFVDLVKMGDSVEGIPKYKEISRRTYSGGAANVAKHCLQLGARVFLIDNDPTWHGFTYDDQITARSGLRSDLGWLAPFEHDYLNSAPVHKTRFYVDGMKSFGVNLIDDVAQKHSLSQAHDFKHILQAFLVERSEEDNRAPFAPDMCVAADNRHGMFSAASARSLVKTCQERGLRLLVDSQMSQSEPDWSIWDGCDDLYVNVTEWESLHHHEMTDCFIHKKLGAAGSVIEHSGILEVYHEYDGFKVDVVDTLGAGDAFMAASAVFGDDHIANAWAALSCTRRGTELPKFEELERLLND